MEYDVALLQEFFLKAAVRTYAGKDKKLVLPDGSKKFVHVNGSGRFCYADTYVTNGEFSGGQTFIYDSDRPVWLMQYHGWCKNDDSRVLAFLKEILAKTYLDGEFCGGRGKYGSWKSDDGSLVYENTPTQPPSTQEFVDFVGYERIWRQQPNGQTEVFWHRYQGMLLGEAAR